MNNLKTWLNLPSTRTNPIWTHCMEKQRSKKELLTWSSALFMYLNVYPHRVCPFSVAWLNRIFVCIEILNSKKQDVIIKITGWIILTQRTR